MYIAPGTQIVLYKGVPLDSDYDNTVYFPNPQSQIAYFDQFEFKIFPEQYYQRHERGYLRLKARADELYGYNYMIWRNTAYVGNNGKYWFAFVDNVTWINNEVAEIHYTVDIIQTWLFEAELEECFIERQHAPTDHLGDNIIPEDFQLGDYMDSYIKSSGHLGSENVKIVVAATFDADANPQDGKFYGLYYSGLYYNVFNADSSGLNAVNTFLSNYSTKAEGIVSVFMMHGDFVVPGKTYVDYPAYYDITVPKFVDVSSNPIYGFIPRNNKLYTYPYCMLYVTNNLGGSAIYPNEYFNGSDPANCDFRLMGDMSPSPSVMLIPKNFKGVAQENVDEMFTITGYPQCTFNIDTYRAWLAQHNFPTSFGDYQITTQSVQEAYNYIPNLIEKEHNWFRDNQAMLPFQNEIMETAIGTLKDWASNAVRPLQAKGNTNTSSIFTIGKMDFDFYNKHIRSELARRIDKYFEYYGYAQNRIAMPNRHCRIRWTYLKTRDCHIKGDLPNDVKKALCALYNKGIRWWDKDATVGDYSQNNWVEV